MTITIVILTTFVLYRLAAGRPVANIVAAIAITGLYALLDPTLRDLPIVAYVSAFMVIWLGFQVIMPAVEAPIRFRRINGRIPELRFGRLSLALVPAGA